MQKITLSKVKAACRKAYAEETLLFQNWQGSYGYRLFVNTEDGPKVVCCAIGAALSNETLNKIDSLDLHTAALDTIAMMSELPEMETEELPFTWDEVEEEDLIEIQQAHDELCGDRTRASTEYQNYLDRFLKLIAE